MYETLVYETFIYKTLVYEEEEDAGGDEEDSMQPLNP